MMALWFAFIRLGWRRFWCDHRGGTVYAMPHLEVLKDLLSGRISVEEYRKQEYRAAWRRCLSCGATLEGKGSCDDCGAFDKRLITKDDHHGGVKVVCFDRDACHQRSPG